MSRSSDRKIIGMIREQYESLVYRALIETEIKDSQIMHAAGLEVTRKKDSAGGRKGEKLTIHSVEKRGDETIVKLVSPDNITAPITPMSAGLNQPTQEYTLQKFEDEFEV